MREGDLRFGKTSDDTFDVPSRGTGRGTLSLSTQVCIVCPASGQEICSQDEIMQNEGELQESRPLEDIDRTNTD